MESLIESIRLATTNDATDDVRAAGANACRTILIALEAKAGEPLAPPIAPVVNASPIATIAAGLRGMPVDQLLDLAIARLRAALPPDAQAVNISPVRFQLLPVGALASTKAAGSTTP
jgi:hypothetical protein